MEEELSENELEERMYAMLHYVDETQANVSSNKKEIDLLQSAPLSTIRRYWRTGSEQNSIYQKINDPKEPVNNNKDGIENNQSKAKDKKESSNNSTIDMSIFQEPVSQNIKKTIEILENDDVSNVVELESSDEDEVIEITLPPKPTITIESSDEDDVTAVTTDTENKKNDTKPVQDKPSSDRDATSSPVLSAVSSVSDEFIRGDCIALNISSKHPNNQSFDFSLHGSDLLDLQTPTKKKKKKKIKEATSTPLSTPTLNKSAVNSVEECFATPKSKAKNKRQRTKSYRVSQKSVPSADVYDSDSNHSIAENSKTQSPYSVTDKSMPNIDVYESDSNQSDKNRTQSVNPSSKDVESSDSSIPHVSVNETIVIETKSPKKSTNDSFIVDLTEPDNITIDENIVMANVSGITEVEDYSDENIIPQSNLSRCGSTKIPAILNADLDFDNLKGNNKSCRSRRYSLSTLRAEMEKFYNESWGGEEFNHREIQKNMSRDKSLWVIDPRDRMPSLSKRKVICNYCNRVGHRDETCRMKPPVCYMCGSTGHYEPRCPKKICVNCGSPNHMYSTMCANCSNWGYIKCAECGQNGHPSSHCPDIWRRYHNTISLDTPLEENRQFKKHYQLFCSGCTRRGHLIHTCRITLPFSGLPMNSPYVSVYRPTYQIQGNQNISNQQNSKHKSSQDNTSSPTGRSSRNEGLKRQSKSPITCDHQNKRRNFGILGMPNNNESPQRTKSPSSNNLQRKNSQSKDQTTVNKEPVPANNPKKCVSENKNTEEALDFIPISSDNHDKQGQIIQHNEVSDTSEVITSARVYITKEIVDELKMEDGKMWLNETLKKNKVTLENDNIIFYLSINGSTGNQEAFRAELREWIYLKTPRQERPLSESDADVTLDSTNDQSDSSNNIPKNRNKVLRQLNKAFDYLKKDIGDPKTMYKELKFLQNRHQQLLKQKSISQKQLSKNKDNINGMLRKLNMVLLGQAGLADGSRHMRELYSLQEKLINFRQKNIPITLRKEIGEHYHCIFAAIPRNDYSDLLGKFYNSKQKQVFKKNIYDKPFTLSPKLNKKKSLNAIQYPRNFNTGVQNENNSCFAPRHMSKITKNKLIFYHQRLINSPTNDIVLRKTRSELLKQIHMNIAMIGTNNLSPNDLKKMRKLQEQAHLFLTSV